MDSCQARRKAQVFNLLMVDEFASVLLEDYCDDVGDGKLKASNTAP